MTVRTVDTTTAQEARTPRFPLGATYAAPGALHALRAASLPAVELLTRHVRGDWGDVCPDDAACNELALIEGTRLWSRYRTSRGEKILIITEWDRSLTTVLLPEDY